MLVSPTIGYEPQRHRATSMQRNQLVNNVIVNDSIAVKQSLFYKIYGGPEKGRLGSEF